MCHSSTMWKKTPNLVTLHLLKWLIHNEGIEDPAPKFFENPYKNEYALVYIHVIQTLKYLSSNPCSSTSGLKWYERHKRPMKRQYSAIPVGSGYNTYYVPQHCVRYFFTLEKHHQL